MLKKHCCSKCTGLACTVVYSLLCQPCQLSLPSDLEKNIMQGSLLAVYADFVFDCCMM